MNSESSFGASPWSETSMTYGLRATSFIWLASNLALARIWWEVRFRDCFVGELLNLSSDSRCLLFVSWAFAKYDLVVRGWKFITSMLSYSCKGARVPDISLGKCLWPILLISWLELISLVLLRCVTPFLGVSSLSLSMTGASWISSAEVALTMSSCSAFSLFSVPSLLLQSLSSC